MHPDNHKMTMAEIYLVHTELLLELVHGLVKSLSPSVRPQNTQLKRRVSLYKKPKFSLRRIRINSPSLCPLDFPLSFRHIKLYERIVPRTFPVDPHNYVHEPCYRTTHDPGQDVLIATSLNGAASRYQLFTSFTWKPVVVDYKPRRFDKGKSEITLQHV